MISPSFFCQLKVHASQKKKKLTKGYFSPFFLLSNPSPSLTSEWAGRSFTTSLCPVFFTWDWSQPTLRSILTHSPCFVSWKFLILLMQTEMLSSAVHHALGSRAWAGQLFLFFLFLNTSPRSWKKGQRNPLNPWMDSHQRRMRLRERQRGIQGDGGWCFGSRQSELLEWNNEKQNIRGDKIRR